MFSLGMNLIPSSLKAALGYDADHDGDCVSEQCLVDRRS